MWEKWSSGISISNQCKTTNKQQNKIRAYEKWITQAKKELNNIPDCETDYRIAMPEDIFRGVNFEELVGAKQEPGIGGSVKNEPIIEDSVMNESVMEGPIKHESVKQDSVMHEAV